MAGLEVELTGGDAALGRRVAAGERAAAEELARRLIPRVRRTVRALLGGQPQQLEDTVQSCLLEILRAAGSFRGEAKLETWATSITVRHTIRLARRERRWMGVVDDEVDPSDVGGPEPTARLGEGLPRGVDEYLSELPEIHRVALVLRHGFGYSMEEIAEMTGASANTVKARLRNGKLKLRRMVAAEVEGEAKEDV
jgi:RNA polymerase sigma-70 factor (ECF subfamily)